LAAARVSKIWLLGDFSARNGSQAELHLPSGKHTKSNRKWPFIVDLPMKNDGFP
jgi:hypothetical protein